MPLYEYRCEACGHTCEVLQGLHEPDPTVCPRCGAPRLARLVSRVSFRLKGGGWYETDFKKEGRRNVADDGAGPAADAADKKADKKEATTETAKPAPAAGEAKTGETKTGAAPAAGAAAGS